MPYTSLACIQIYSLSADRSTWAAEADTNRRQIFQLGVATAIATAVDLQHVSPAFAAKRKLPLDKVAQDI